MAQAAGTDGLLKLPRGNRELIIRANVQGRALFAGSGPPGRAGKSLSDFQGILSNSGARLRPILQQASATGFMGVMYAVGAPGAPGLNLGTTVRYFQVEASPDALDGLRSELAKSPLVEAAYLKPPSDLPFLNDMPPSAPTPPVSTPDFVMRQTYLGSPPVGIGAQMMWGVPGGTGSGVGVTDLEWAWEDNHEDLQRKRGLLGGTPSGDTNHGTAVVGVIGANQNGLGVSGIASGASLGWHAFSAVSSQTIENAAAACRPGDILLLEIHRAGPRQGFAARDDQKGYIPIEWWPDDLEAITFATGRGVIVVEAGGNGGEDLDDGLYDVAGEGFPPDWTNPFRRKIDSGAILVGAGAPPPGTHGRDWGPDRSRLDFSNFGSVFDVQAWGREVTSCGYGDLQGGVDARRWYTDQFSGTSSASPIVAAALACLQGVLIASGRRVLTPAEARAVLRATGSPQQDGPSAPMTQRIGSRPDLKAMMQWVDARIP